MLQQRLAGFSEILGKFQMQILSLRAARLSSTLASSPLVSEAKWFCCYPQGPRGGCEVLRVLAGATSALSSALLRNIVSSFSSTKEIKLLLKVWRGGGVVVGVGGALAGVSISSGPPGGLQVNLADSQTPPRAPGEPSHPHWDCENSSGFSAPSPGFQTRPQVPFPACFPQNGERSYRPTWNWL